jgi:hypothetical protein
MPEEKKKDPLIDVGETEGADVELESKQEDITHDVIEDSAKSNDTVAQSNEQPVVQDSKQETEIQGPRNRYRFEERIRRLQ